MMSSQEITTKEELDYLQATKIATSSVLPFTLKTAIDLDLFEIIAKFGPGSKVSAAEIVSKLPAKNSNAPNIIDRILRLLSAHSIFDCDVVNYHDGITTRLYGISSIGRYFLQNEDGISLIPTLNEHLDERTYDRWKIMKEATMEGGLLSFAREHGDEYFEVVAKDKNLSNYFNQEMSKQTAFVMEKLQQIYKGFEGLTQVIDVGGGWGTALKLIVSKYPQIKGINFDLPLVVEDAPNMPGEEHVGGDMFNKVPNGEVIFIRSVLHDWGDQECLRLLKNCFEAIPEFGKVILVESIVPELPIIDIVTITTLDYDVSMLTFLPGAKERTFKEFETLAVQAGFSALKPVCPVYFYWVMELI